MQQINLYLPVFRQQKNVFSAASMLQVSLIFLVTLGVVYGYSYWQYQKLDRQLANASKQAEQVQVQVEGYKNKQVAVIRSKLLEREVARLERELKQGQDVFKLISEGSFGGTAGFSEHFKGLARGHVDGMWLTEINMEQGGQTLELNGVTLSADLVPRYLQKLAGESVFESIVFNVLDIVRSEEDKGKINFIVSTNIPDKQNDLAQSTF